MCEWEPDKIDRDMMRLSPVKNDAVIKPEDILHQLWSSVVKPILDGLGFSVVSTLISVELK